MINKLKYALISLLVGVCSSFSAYADDSVESAPPRPEVDENCSIAFNNGKVIPESFTVCQQDVALNAMSLSIGSVVKTNDSAKSLYRFLGIPIPSYSDIVNFISKPIGAVAAAAVNLSMILVIAIAGVRLFMFGHKAMKDAELAKMARDPSSYKSFLGFALVASLAYPFGDISLAQLLVIGAGLIAIMITTYLFTSMIAIFDFSSDQDMVQDAYENFIPQGSMYATSLLSSLYGAQSAALTSNFMSVSPENASLIVPNNKVKWWQDVLASILGKLGVYEQKDPTAKQYFDGIFGDSYLTLRQPSGLTLSRSGAHGARGAQEITRSVAASNLTINDGRIVDDAKGGFTSPMFEKSFRYQDFFDAATTLSVSSTIPRISPAVLKQIAKSKAIDELSSLLIDSSDVAMDSDVEKGRIAKAGSKLVELIKEIIEANPEVTPIDVVSAVQSIALGAISAEALISNRQFISKSFHPFLDSSEFIKSFAKEPFHYVFAEAMKGAKELRTYNCLRNFSQAGREFQFLKKATDGRNKWDSDFTSSFDGGDIYPICLYPSVGSTDSFDSLAPKKMVDAAFEAVEKIEQGVSGSGNVESVLGHVELIATHERFTTDGTAESEKAAALERAHVHRDNIAKYFARVAAVGKFAALTFIDNGEEEAKSKFMSNMRLQGALAISSYFMQLSQEQQKYSEVIYNSEPKVTVTSNLFKASGMPAQTGKIHSEISLSEKRGLLPTNNWIISAHLDTDNVAQAAQSLRGDDPTNDGDQVVSGFVAEAADMVIPSQDILMAGFGLKGDTWLESMGDCSTTTNCVEFTQHPIATISLFGKDMLHTGMMIVMVDALIQALNKKINGSDEEDTNETEGGMFSKVAAKLGNTVKSLASKYFVVTWVIKILSIVSGILAIFGGVFIFAGMFIGYLIPMMPFVTQIMMWMAWFAEFLILFVVIPLLVAFSFVNKEDGQPLFKPTSLISMLAAVVLKAPLIFVAFMVFFTMSYAGIYVINSTMFTLFSIEFSTQGVALVSNIMNIIHAVIFFVFVVSMYFIMFKNLTKLMSEIPDYVLRPMGVQSLNVQVSTGVESFIMTAAMKNELTKALQAAGGGAGGMIGDKLKGKGKADGDNNAPDGDSPTPKAGNTGNRTDSNTSDSDSKSQDQSGGESNNLKGSAKETESKSDSSDTSDSNKQDDQADTGDQSSAGDDKSSSTPEGEQTSGR
jgi:conjugal transfer/type IV secretion protein DotA/TraY